MSESREMLRRGDAAYLPSIPGRGYLQVGNEELELVQVAYTGDRYRDPQVGRPPKVLWPGRGSVVVEEKEPPELYKAIIEGLARLAERREVGRQYAPWPKVLPTRLALSDLLVGPTGDGLTAERYLAEGDVWRMRLGRPEGGEIQLNPAVNRWLNGENGWLEEGMNWGRLGMRPVVGLVDDPFEGKQRPLVADLPQGHLVVFGASGWGKSTLVRSLVVSLAASHSPSQVQIYLLDLGGRSLGMLAGLPHVGAVIEPDEEGYRERVAQLMRELEQVVVARKEVLGRAKVGDVYTFNSREKRVESSGGSGGYGSVARSGDRPQGGGEDESRGGRGGYGWVARSGDRPQIGGSGGERVLPGIVVVVDHFAEFVASFGPEQGGEQAAGVMERFVGLVRQGRPYGVHFVVTATRLSEVPTSLFGLLSQRWSLKLAEGGDYRAVVGGQVGDLGDGAGRGVLKEGLNLLRFQVAEPLRVGDGQNEMGELERLGQVMSGYVAARPGRYGGPLAVAALPKGVLFRDLLGVTTGLPLADEREMFGRLKGYMAGNWARSYTAEGAGWLRGMVGVMAGNRPREIVFEAKEDGVHGMIAGGTGSGKSELLLTLIVSLALNYDPAVLNFVLVDYKGGGAFKPFEGLPHCVESVTNLNKGGVRRMFAAIQAEMGRRQKMNADTGTKDIVEYRQKGYHLQSWPNGGRQQGYPHLFIIIDEYAEMISDSPEFKSELESITRVGRAQGVNLLLASQRPMGVTDQMRANIKYRICLRVEGVETSREMLRRPDAAFLPSGLPGRGYLQVGNEQVELMQMAYTGEGYPALARGEGEPKFYEVVVGMAQRVMREVGRERPPTPWPASLPQKLTLPGCWISGIGEKMG